MSRRTSRERGKSTIDGSVRSLDVEFWSMKAATFTMASQPRIRSFKMPASFSLGCHFAFSLELKAPLWIEFARHRGPHWPMVCGWACCDLQVTILPQWPKCSRKRCVSILATRGAELRCSSRAKVHNKAYCCAQCLVKLIVLPQDYFPSNRKTYFYVLLLIVCVHIARIQMQVLWPRHVLASWPSSR